jgi:gliding motility-associated lipoprotein GldJ
MITSCSGGNHPSATDPGKASQFSGLEFDRNGKKGEGFAVRDFDGQPDPINMVFIEGGRTVMGSLEEDILQTRDNIERTVTIASFYMDQTEVTNIAWLEYLHFANDSGQQYFEEALPDTTVWAKELAFNDPYVDHYLRYPGFRQYPVVGVSWEQANNYAVWRTDAHNRQLAMDNGTDEEVALAEAGERIPLESGIIVPNYRLPTEAEWEYAAKAMIGTQYNDENQSHARLYPWNGHTLRNAYGQTMGTFMANFKRGRGDYAGIAGKLNDGHMITCEVFEFPANDYGFYNMAGNVNEWVMDLYRPLSFNDMEDLNPVRKNNFQDGDDPNVYLYDKANYTTFIGQNSQDEDVRVYKGGSWRDVAYWLSPGTRRYLEADSSTADIGFRCAMIKADAIDN